MNGDFWGLGKLLYATDGSLGFNYAQAGNDAAVVVGTGMTLDFGSDSSYQSQSFSFEIPVNQEAEMLCVGFRQMITMELSKTKGTRAAIFVDFAGTMKLWDFPMTGVSTPRRHGRMTHPDRFEAMSQVALFSPCGMGVDQATSGIKPLTKYTATVTLVLEKLSQIEWGSLHIDSIDISAVTFPR